MLLVATDQEAIVESILRQLVKLPIVFIEYFDLLDAGNRPPIVSSPDGRSRSLSKLPFHGKAKVLRSLRHVSGFDRDLTAKKMGCMPLPVVPSGTTRVTGTVCTLPAAAV